MRDFTAIPHRRYKFEKKPNKRNLNIRVYRDVRCLSAKGTIDSGVIYTVQFETKHFPRVNWEVSKRLIFGSLIAISSDDFETALFATVVNRDAKQV